MRYLSTSIAVVLACACFLASGCAYYGRPPVAGYDDGYWTAGCPPPAGYVAQPGSKVVIVEKQQTQVPPPMLQQPATAAQPVYPPFPAYPPFPPYPPQPAPVLMPTVAR